MKDQGIWGQLKFRFRYGGTHLKLVFANSAIFIAFQLAFLVAWLFKAKPEVQLFTGEYFAASSDPWWLLTKPWTAISYMFMHADILHLLFNMLSLYFAGSMFENLLGGRRVMTVYLLGGLFALLFHVLSIEVFPIYESHPHTLIVGASGSVSAIFMALAVYAPNMEVALFGIFRMRLMWLAAFYVLFELLRVESSDGIAHFAHLGGALFGYLFVVLLKSGTDLSKPVYILFDGIGVLFSRKPKMKVVRDAPGKKQKQTPPKKAASATVQDFDKMSSDQKQKVIDAILDKISRSGYDALTAREKEILFKASNEQ
jgi:membrane associated rhomboid family serine protease